jgi:hypothetical protein
VWVHEAGQARASGAYVSGGIMVEDESVHADLEVPLRRLRKRYVERVEVARRVRVRVPCLVQKVFPVQETLTIKTKRFVEVPVLKEVEEQFTVVENQRATRPKITWVKQIVPEQYEEKVPKVVDKLVKRPVTRLVEKEEFIDVTVPSSKPVEVDAYRIDEVQGVKVVEVEEWEDVELVEQAVGKRQRREVKEIQQREAEGRNFGTKIYPAGAVELRNLPEDEATLHGLHSSMVLHRSITDYELSNFTGQDIPKGPLFISVLEIGDEEHFTIRNRSQDRVSLDGWTVHDIHVTALGNRNIFRFPQGYVLAPKQFVKVYSGVTAGAFTDEPHCLVWRQTSIWKAGDRAYLCNPSGEVMHVCAISGDDLNDSVKYGVADFEIERTYHKAKLQEVRH